MNQSRKGNGSDARVRDEELVRRFLASVSELSQREVGRRIAGVSQSDVSRWRNNEWEYITTKKREALREHLRKEEESGPASDVDDTVSHPSPLGDPTGSPAERLIYYFSHPDAVRQLGPAVSVEDRVKAAYAIAIEDGWAEAEIDKLDRWRREALGTSAEGGD